ncbi:hypothetical protein MHYP_G00030080 [Metynnis hypsauchen]
MGSGTLQKTIVSEHSLSLHLQVQVKTLPCKAKAIYNNTQKHRRLLWPLAHLRWTENKVEKCPLVHISNCFWKSWTKEEKDCPDCYQRKVQKPASLMSFGRATLTDHQCSFSQGGVW